MITSCRSRAHFQPQSHESSYRSASGRACMHACGGVNWQPRQLLLCPTNFLTLPAQARWLKLLPHIPAASPGSHTNCSKQARFCFTVAAPGVAGNVWCLRCGACAHTSSLTFGVLAFLRGTRAGEQTLTWELRLCFLRQFFFFFFLHANLKAAFFSIQMRDKPAQLTSVIMQYARRIKC